jgi:hypothetical protein
MRTIWIVATLIAIGTANASINESRKRPEATQWQAMARADLEAARDKIREAHPGILDLQNPQFNDWVESGYQEAIGLVPHVMSYDTALQAVRYYTTGFNDGHLSYSDDVRSDVPVWVAGWRLEMRNGDYVVATTLPDWPARLPPEGHIWLGCDGVEADEILSGDVGPFVRRGSDPAARAIQASSAWMLRPVQANFKECSFRGRDQVVSRYPVVFRPITRGQLFSALSRSTGNGSPSAENTFDLLDGVLWVRAGNFSLRGGTDDAKDLDQMLSELSQVVEARIIVFDVRGNRGGDSSIGDRIFDAATGGLDFDRRDMDSLPRYYAQWRVSGHLLSFLDKAVEDSITLYGTDSARVDEDQDFRAKVLAARSSGEDWVDQEAGFAITQADVIQRNGRLRRSPAAVALLTDSGCVSACLDFADVVLKVPGAIHLGESTGADSVYMVGSVARLPSGNALRVPVKVWRNRPRGNNEPYVPTVRIDLEAGEEKIRQQVLGAIRAPHPGLE